MSYICGRLNGVHFLALRRPLNCFIRTSSQWPHYFHTFRPSLSERKSEATPVTDIKAEHQENGDNTFPVTGSSHNEARRSKYRWSAAEDALAVKMHKEEKPLSEIARALGRSEDAVRPRLLSRFSPSEDAVIMKAQRDGLSWQQLHQQLPLFTILQIKRRYRILHNVHGTHGVRAARRPFSIEEDERLKRLRSQGVPFAEIAKMPPRRVSGAIETRYNRIVPASDRVNTRPVRWWTEDETQRMLAMSKEGVPVATIALKLGKPYRGVTNRRLRALRDLSGEHSTRAKCMWSREDDEQLLQLVASDHTWKNIGQRLKRSESSLQMRWRRLKFLEKNVNSIEKLPSIYERQSPDHQERPSDASTEP